MCVRERERRGGRGERGEETDDCLVVEMAEEIFLVRSTTPTIVPTKIVVVYMCVCIVRARAR